jgi:hypothetical protein
VDLPKTIDVLSTTNNVMLEDKFNLDKPNASNANLANLDNNSQETNALPQLLSDHNVIATKNSTKQLTLVCNAHLDNCQETVD